MNTRMLSDKLKLTATFVFVLILFSLGCDSNKGVENTDGKIHVNGIDIYIKSMGSGTPTFVLHGGPGDSHDTMLQLKALADNHKVIFYDQRASGRSTGDEDTASHTVDNFVEDLEQLRLHFTDGKINIIGGSWGSMVAMQYAMKYSDNVNALVLMSSMGIRSEYFADYQANIVKNRTTEDSLKLEEIVLTDGFAKREPESMKKFWRIYFKAYFCNPDLVNNLQLWMRDSTYPNVQGRFTGIRKFVRNYNLEEDLKKITCPTLILHGDHDPTDIKWIQPIHENIANSQLQIIENAGHWLWVEAPDKVIPLIRNFLNDK